MGKDTLAQETNLARAAVWSFSAADRRFKPGQLVMPVLYGQPIRHVEGPLPTGDDQRWLAELVTRWLVLDCPADRRVPFSLREAADVLGYADGGGKQLQLVRASFARLRSATFESLVRFPGGREEVLQWGLLSHSKFVRPRQGPVRGWTVLHEVIADLVEQGSITYLRRPTWDRLRELDDLAARLWTFLEAERLPTPSRAPWRHNLFAAQSGQPTPERDLPAVAELLRIAHWSARWKVAQRVRQACEAIVMADDRYVLELVSSSEPGMWRLEARREPRNP